MAKIPDFGGLTKKLDIQGLLDSVKSAVAGTGTPLKAPEGDEVAAKFVEVIGSLQNLANLQAEQAKLINTINSKINDLYRDMQAIRDTTATTPHTTAATPKSTTATNKPSSTSPTGKTK